MRTIISIAGTLILFACTQHGNKNEDLESSDVNSKFEEYFRDMDTSQPAQIVGCSGGYYKVLDDRFVIKITPSKSIAYGDIEKFDLSIPSAQISLELLEFKPGKASLMNICSDIQIVNLPKPINTYTNYVGSVVVGKSNPTEVYGNINPKFSFHMKQVVFFNSLGVEQLKIEEELLWKVLDTGTPG